MQILLHDVFPEILQVIFSNGMVTSGPSNILPEQAPLFYIRLLSHRARAVVRLLLKMFSGKRKRRTRTNFLVRLPLICDTYYIYIYMCVCVI